MGASWASLGCSWESLGSFSGAKEPSWAPLGCSCCPSFRLFSLDLLRSRCFSSLGASSGRFGVSKMTLRPFENRAPAEAAARFLKNRRFRSEDGLENAWGLSWARFGCFGGFLGSVLGGLGGSLGTPGGSPIAVKVILELSWASSFRPRCPSCRFFILSLRRSGSLFSSGVSFSPLGASRCRS